MKVTIVTRYSRLETLKLTRAPGRRRLPPGEARLRRCLTTLAAGCCARDARSYYRYCPPLPALVSFPTVAPGSSPRRPTGCCDSCGRRLLLAGDACAGGDLVRPVQVELALGREVQQQRLHVARIERRRVIRHRRCDVRQSDERDVLAHRDLAGLCELAVAARVGSEVDDDRAGA